MTLRLGLVVFAMLGLAADARTAAQQTPPNVPPALAQRAAATGRVRVIVQMDTPARPEGTVTVQSRAAQRVAIRASQDRVIARLSANAFRSLRRFSSIPFMAAEVTPIALAQLAQAPGVVSIVEDRLDSPTLADSIPIVKANQAWSAGYDGTGWTVAVLDTGVDKAHEFLAGKVVSEACYSHGATFGDSAGNCPNAAATQVGSGAGVPCTYASGCDHGTHVAGIAAGSGSSFSGVAKGANIIAIQVFSNVSGCSPCAYVSDQIAGMERVYELRNTYQIAAVNMSLGGGQYLSQASCDADNAGRKAIIDNLRSVGIATVISSGNNNYTNALSAPGCISSAISVGATTKSDVVASYSNSASFLTLLAPGSSIRSSVPGNSYAVFNGTSMAAPHVAGAWAVLKHNSPSASVSTILAALQESATVLDTRNGIAKPRIDLVAALNSAALRPTLTINDVTVQEGNSVSADTRFIVTLSKVSPSTVTVNYLTADITANSADYAPASGTLTFSPGRTSHDIFVTINGDLVVESHETFSVNLSGASNATVADSVGVGRIISEDFTDPFIEAGVTPVRLVHLTELRARIDALRTATGLGAAIWTDASPTGGVTPIKAMHVVEMRTALSQAYVAAGRSAPTFTDPDLAALQVKAVHFDELRNTVVQLELLV